MEMIIEGDNWSFSADPFPAYRTELIFGRNKRDRAFLPVLGNLVPNTETGLLKDGSFKVIKTKKKGTICIVPGKDTTRRALVLLTVHGGFRGGCCYLPEHTTARVLVSAHAGSALRSAISVALLMEPGQVATFKSWGRYGTDFEQYHWNANSLGKMTYTKDEWEVVTNGTEGEEL